MGYIVLVCVVESGSVLLIGGIGTMTGISVGEMHGLSKVAPLLIN